MAKDPVSVQVEDLEMGPDSATTTTCVLIPKNVVPSVRPVLLTVPLPSTETLMAEPLKAVTVQTVLTTGPATTAILIIATMIITVQGTSNAVRMVVEESAHHLITASSLHSFHSFYVSLFSYVLVLYTMKPYSSSYNDFRYEYYSLHRS